MCEKYSWQRAGNGYRKKEQEILKEVLRTAAKEEAKWILFMKSWVRQNKKDDEAGNFYLKPWDTFSS